MTAIPFPVGKGESEVVDRRESAWADPKTWVSIMAVLLTIALFLAGLIVAQLSALSGKIEGLIVVTTKQGADYEAMKEQIHTMKEEIGALREHDAGQERTIAEIKGAVQAQRGK
jgi:multidrug efflux pump subunit AcrB